MNVPFPVSVTLRSEKGAPLTVAEVDANFTNLVDAIQMLASQGVAGLGLIEFDPDTGIVTVLSSNNAVVGSFQLPSRPVRPRGGWLAATSYALGDLVRMDASGTVPRGLIGFVTRTYTSHATDPAADLASGAILPLAYDGKPAQTMRGNYSTLVTYAPGDVVTADSGERYQLFEAAPAGTTPGAPLTANGALVIRDGKLVFPWGQLTVESVTPFRFATVGKPGAGAILVRSMIARTGYIGPNQKGSTDFNGSQAKTGTAPAAAVTLTLAVNGGAVGTVAFAIGSKTATFTTTGGQAIPLQIGDVLTLTAPASQDTALSNLIGFIAAF